jgi:TatD DNase family protein
VIDTHAHLDPDEAAAVLERARAAGVGRVITVGTTLSGCREALALAQGETGVFASLGIHPHEAARSGGAPALEELRGLLAAPRAVAVGETGLDYFRDYAPPEAQRRLFAGQLALAAELGMAVVIHTREADADTLAALAGFEGTVVLHCFSSPGLLERALERRWYVSFAGNVSYRSAEPLREAARLVAADRILVETDSPYLAPVPLRGQRNEPANVMHTLAVLARARDEGTAELAARIDANASAAFSL